jgi:hypothetical protein
MFTPHPSALLLPALARTSVWLVEAIYHHITEAQLALLCAGGQPDHPITIKLRCQKLQGRQASVRALVGLDGSAVQLEASGDAGGE